MTTTQTQVEAGPAMEMSPLPAKGTSEGGDVVPDAASTQSGDQSKKMDRATYLKIISAGFSFLVTGVNDGSIGAILPYVIREYDVNTAIVSSV